MAKLRLESLTDYCKERYPHIDVREGILFDHDGKFITSAGGAKSFEAALYLMQLMYGDSIARRIAEGLVIDWDLTAIDHTIIKQKP